ncbi:unnamed protein product [Microthlaspi erraticum]|uniref:Glycosyltransferase family 92 protein n=1 Tax=Microthlaspi erraticum TaxID=1685480 RepID=A0A6D2JG60_9BRAS|nr:unnamed protein product [Microthlaspi erraticum]
MTLSFKTSSPSSSRSTPKSIAGGDDSHFFHHSNKSTYRAHTTTLFLILLSLSFFGFFSLYSSPNVIYRAALFATTRPAKSGIVSYVINAQDSSNRRSNGPRRIRAEGVLWPGWEILVIVSPEEKVMPPLPGENYTCFYPNGEKSAARFAAVLPFTNRSAFRCGLPGIYRHHHPIPTPVFASSMSFPISPETRWPDLPLWNFVVFEAISTENDVVLFVKGPNRGLGSNRPPESFLCVFGDESDSAIKTPVTSSVQEVFRCPFPNVTIDTPVKIYLEAVVTGKDTAKTVPSVAYYTPKRRLAKPSEKSLLCATTMVFNVAKYLREWVMYHSTIGIRRFIIYDNGSDDELNDVVEVLKSEGYDVIKVLWIWPKTQEAGFSHAAVYGNDSCTWMMYLDVDEFLFSPAWDNRSKPSDQMIRSLLPSDQKSMIGQVSFKSYEFGPSNQTEHPRGGVTQGYTCRRVEEQRHKSIVRLSAVEHSLYTAIHHFGLKGEYEWRVADVEEGVVNHYKYQAWREFKAKFKRRVSAYVVDWTRVSNPKSRDRTPGLGFRPIEPEGWAQKFCEITDLRLKRLTRKWFGYPGKNGYRMVWQR